MSTEIRPELSKKNPYWIDRHRYYELKHFCLQYHRWEKILRSFTYVRSNDVIHISDKDISDPTCKIAMAETYCQNRIAMVRKAALETDKIFCDFILKAVTQGYSYNTMRTKYDVPCGKDIWYEMYHKFFWLLDTVRE